MLFLLLWSIARTTMRLSATVQFPVRGPDKRYGACSFPVRTNTPAKAVAVVNQVAIASLHSVCKLHTMGAMNSHAPLRQAARLAFYTSLLLLFVKFTAYYLTDSKAILADAIESIINVITGAFLMISVSVSTQPVDDNHPYGHGKIEAFSAGLEGGLIVIASIMILLESLPAFFSPAPPQNTGGGIVLLGATGIVNMAVGVYLLHSAKKYNSDALEADGRHLLTDFQTTAGVIIALFLVRLTGWLWLDPLVACLVGVNILLPGLRLTARASKNLMNEADPALLTRITSGLNQIRKEGWLFPHKLRSLRSGRYHHVDLHIALPRYWTLEQVHAAEEEITGALLAAIGEEGDIMIHTDPCRPFYCRHCDIESCPVRSQAFAETVSWSVEDVTGSRPDGRQSGKGNGAPENISTGGALQP